MGIINESINKVRENNLFYQAKITGQGESYLSHEYTYNVKIIAGADIQQTSSVNEYYSNVPVMGMSSTIDPDLKEGDIVFIAFINKNNTTPVIINNTTCQESNNSIDNSGDATGEIVEGSVDLSVITVGEQYLGKTIFVWPDPNEHRITSKFGYRSASRKHHGIDLNSAKGNKIVSAISGTVVHVVNTLSQSGGYGRYIDIENENGIRIRYAHGSEILVSLGQEVEAGQEVFVSGRSGYAEDSYAAHLHYEIIVYPNNTMTRYNPRFVRYKEGPGNDTSIFPVLSMAKESERTKLPE